MTAEPEVPLTRPVQRVSVIAPMLNEGAHIEQFVADLAAQDFQGETEIFVADGGSTDGSVERLTTAAKRAGLKLTVIDSPSRWVSYGLNACIRRATGDLIVRVDCHSRYPPDYVRLCAAAAEETGADNVGGVVVAEGRTPTERAVACAMDSPFGGIGWTRRGRSSGRVEVDTVTYGAFRPEAFECAGLFDESLVRNQDDEFNFRLRSVGGRIVLDPSIRLSYTPRGTLGGVFRQYYQYGLWKIPVMLKHGKVISARSLAPLGLAGSLAVLAVGAPLSSGARRMLAAELAVYAGATLAFGVAAVRGRREEWELLPTVVAVFPAFHLGYGAGMLRACVRALRGG